MSKKANRFGVPRRNDAMLLDVIARGEPLCMIAATYRHHGINEEYLQALKDEAIAEGRWTDILRGAKIR
jgi:hypothetical protein